ncbi:DUF523 domain-containing protein [Clostridium vincentii]|uniref:Uncharacterized protein n=1 Tax=Clostridium vincentii TaxID=52704 RepID=A0A2T0BGE8_9CLOT|nr:DUF523 domain-containing protein [Clostridium vincentii]PRR82907.1 hypothetical protein CLVI_13500 [Clostridium vincentii]
MYLISACLCGVNCKYSGENNLNEDCLALLEQDQAILICPEQLGGLATPRPSAEIIGDAESISTKGIGKVITKDGKDVTAAFLRGAKETIKIAKASGTLAAILKDGSPSCGCNYVYDGNFAGEIIEGEGITCTMLKDAGIEVISDEEYSKKICESKTLIFLSDYDYKRKEVNEDEIGESILYTLTNNDEEIITDLPPIVEKQMKKLVLYMAREMFDINDLDQLSEATGLTVKEIEEIIKESNHEK